MSARLSESGERQARRLREAAVVGRLGAVPVRQAAGEGPLRLAAAGRRPPAADAGATGAAHRRHRLAPRGCARSGSTAGVSLKPRSFNARNLAYAWRCGRTHLIARAASLRRRALRRRSVDPMEDLSALLVAS